MSTDEPVPAIHATPGDTAADNPHRTPNPPGRDRSRRRIRLFLALLALAGLSAAAYWGWDWYCTRREWGRAQDALNQLDLAGGARHLERYLQSRPNDAAGWFLAARTARRRGQFEEAARHLARYEELGGGEDAVRLERDLIRVQQGHMGEADVRLRATVGPDHPDAPFVLEALARGYMAVDRWADARKACELWRVVQPDHPWAWLWEAWVCERVGQSDLAVECYRRAWELLPDARDTRIGYAHSLLKQRRPADAAPHYRWVLDRDPGDPEALLGLAECHIDSGEAAQAAPLLDRVPPDRPEAARLPYLRGKAMLQSDPAGAEAWLRKAVKGQTDDAEALYQLVQSLRAQGKDAEADALSRDLEALRRDLQRLRDLLPVIATRPADPEPCREAGVIALRVGQSREGLNLLREALRRKPDHRPTHAALAEYYQKVGEQGLADHHKRLAELP